MITGKGVGIALVAVFVFILVNVTRVGWLLLFDSVLWGLMLSYDRKWCTERMKEVAYPAG